MPLAGISRDARGATKWGMWLDDRGAGADTERIEDSNLQDPKGKPKGLLFTFVPPVLG